VEGSVQLDELWQSANDRNLSPLPESIGALLDGQKFLFRQSIPDRAPVEPSRWKDSEVAWCERRNKRIRFFLVISDLNGRCPQQARAASMLQLEAILGRRCCMMAKKPYLILAHFAGNIDRASRRSYRW
jgi:hypothetical protein